MRTLALGALILILTACAGGATGATPATTPGASAISPSPPASPGFGSIDHPTGATEVVLRFEEGGGFVMPAFLATQAPAFTLYGDGTIVFRSPSAEPPEPIGSVYPMPPFMTARLTEDQVQELLTYALGESGLGVARPNYPNDQVADASTVVFTVNAGGLRKTVSIYALGLEMEGMADTPARAAFARLAVRLQNIDTGGGLAASEFAPEQYRGVLLEGQPGMPDPKPWPWSDVAPVDFVSNADPNGFPMPSLVMTPEEVEALGIVPFAGGFQGLTLNGPGDGKVYSFSLRPLLLDETE